MGELLPRCVLCEAVPKRGIADGFRICGCFVCEDCERRIMENTIPFDNLLGLRKLARKFL